MLVDAFDVGTIIDPSPISFTTPDSVVLFLCYGSLVASARY